MGIEPSNLLGIGKRIKNNFDLQFIGVSATFAALSILVGAIGYLHTIEEVEQTVQVVNVPLANGKTSPQKALLIERFQRRPFLSGAMTLGLNSLTIAALFSVVAWNQKSPKEYRKRLGEARDYIESLKRSEDPLSLADLTDLYSYKENYFPEVAEDNADLVLSFYELKNLEVQHQVVLDTEPIASQPKTSKKRKEPTPTQSTSSVTPQGLPTFVNPAKLKERKPPKAIQSQSVSQEDDPCEALINPGVIRADAGLEKIGKAIEEKNNSINKKNPIKFSGQVLKSGVLHRFFFLIPQETDIGALLKSNLANFEYIITPFRGYSRVAINPGTIYHNGRAYIGFDLFLDQPERVNAEKVLEPKYSNSISWDVLIGLNELNEPITVDLSKNFNGLFAGIPGSGKSRTAMGAIFSLFFTNTPDQLRLIVIDGKGAWSSWNKKDGGEWLPWLEMPVMGTESVEEIESVFGLLQQTIQERSCFGHDDLKTWNEKHPENQKPMYVVLIDEYSKCVKDFNDRGYDFEKNVESIISLGRSAGIRVVISNQIFTSENSSQSIRRLPDWKVCLKVSDRIAYKQIFDQSNLSVISEPGHFYWISGEEAYPQFGHSMWIEQEPLLQKLGIELPPEVFGIPSTRPPAIAEQLSLLVLEENEESGESDGTLNTESEESAGEEDSPEGESSQVNVDFWNN